MARRTAAPRSLRRNLNGICILGTAIVAIMSSAFGRQSAERSFSAAQPHGFLERRWRSSEKEAGGCLGGATGAAVVQDRQIYSRRVLNRGRAAEQSDRYAGQLDIGGISSYAAAMYAAGGLLGPALDGMGHGNFGVLTYHDPAPFPVVIFGLQIFKTAPWVPFLFGVAGLLIGALYWWLDDALQTSDDRRSPSAIFTLAAVAAFAANYIASGFLWSQGVAAGPLAIILGIWDVLTWWIFDSTTAGLIVSVLTAVGGPLIEVFLVNAPWWDLYVYNQADLWGVDSWIPWVYLCGAPAVGCVARLVRQRLGLTTASKAKA
eukprot:TRINITY_DN52762_c0_g1_i1.p1 TRINITY_DN52762_c0_g1~~TRINITY_DN52762_c0_g1_i1.p1  ORF type:complete len:337 (+),score=51.45 TRINITY_DN52762_c0_g1_i1:60-1013(+)